ncbi:MAG: hypothetical protein A2Y62_01045 [Candidatus Fischerbacteria bacterium RBG_13_37_8]|uniref:Uncharacterized protein n=1 Tax=Candidatus Fischerbacteria bacterium RBG_13_37_8 TaxID=1817863 RepID=A0A1F5VT72_9BACT|nr:MAG: hypothetical protein A2Y62_01045 [Candidatus Fischerbacteria bacterium RBG_13_37_8]
MFNNDFQNLLDHAYDAAYGTIATGQTGQCLQCYSLIAPAANRPSTHWDVTLVETVERDSYAEAWHVYGYHIGREWQSLFARPWKQRIRVHV